MRNVDSDEIIFRIICASALVAVGVTRDYYWFIRPYLRSEQRRKPVEVLNDLFQAVFESNRDGARTVPMMVAVVSLFAGLGAYIVDPSLMAWSAVRLPRTVRWTGAAIGWAGALGEMWAFTCLGRQYSPLLRIRKDHSLVTSGPYAWIRHPLYSFGLPFVFGLALAAANWFLLLTAGIGFAFLMTVRVPREEAMLVEAFGDSYREHIKRTGRFLPRLRAG